MLTPSIYWAVSVVFFVFLSVSMLALVSLDVVPTPLAWFFLLIWPAVILRCLYKQSCPTALILSQFDRNIRWQLSYPQEQELLDVELVGANLGSFFAYIVLMGAKGSVRCLIFRYTLSQIQWSKLRRVVIGS